MNWLTYINSNIDVDKQMQLLPDSSLFDLGFYFSMRINNPHYNKEDKIVKNILTVIKTILNTDSSLNMSLLNSISYTMSRISCFFEINTSELDSLTKIITINILKSVDEELYSTSDLLICNALNPKMYHDVSSSSLQAGEIDMDTYIACTWQKLLYSFEKSICHLDLVNINDAINKLIMDLSIEITMEKGLAGIGIGLILNEK